MTKTRQLRQERQDVVGVFTNEYKHDMDANDQVLNLSQHRNAAFYRSLQRPRLYGNSTLEQCVERGVELMEQREASEAAAKAARGERQTQNGTRNEDWRAMLVLAGVSDDSLHDRM